MHYKRIEPIARLFQCVVLCLRRWPNTKTTLAQRLRLAGIAVMYGILMCSGPEVTHGTPY